MRISGVPPPILNPSGRGCRLCSTSCGCVVSLWMVQNQFFHFSEELVTAVRWTQPGSLHLLNVSQHMIKSGLWNRPRAAKPLQKSWEGGRRRGRAESPAIGFHLLLRLPQVEPQPAHMSSSPELLRSQAFCHG